MRRPSAPEQPPPDLASRTPFVLVVVGPGGVGKGTVIRRLVEADGRLWLSRSWTTRQRRAREPAGAYEFVSRPQFEAFRDEGRFLEWAEILGELYGTPEPHPPPGSDVVLEIDVQGARQVLAKYPEAVVVLLSAPSLEAQVERLRGRGDPEAQIEHRVRLGAQEVSEARSIGAVEIVNDDLETTVTSLGAIISTARNEVAGGPRP
ncbi:MAG: guanylate kinase [Acidimicrobiales bacterium]